MEQQPQTRADIEAEIAFRTSAIEEKRKGREAMLASGMTVEPEIEDMDMQEHMAGLAEAQEALSRMQAAEDDARIIAAGQSPLPGL